MPSAVRVFISYSHEDAAFVARLRTALQGAGADIWIDHERLQPGAPNWQLAIREGIEQANVVIYVASPTGARSPFVYDEINLARSLGRRVIPLWAEGNSWPDCVPLGWGSTQYIDARDAQYKSGVAILLDTLGIRPAQTAPAPPAPIAPVRSAAPFVGGASFVGDAGLLAPSGGGGLRGMWKAIREQAAQAEEVQRRAQEQQAVHNDSSEKDAAASAAGAEEASATANRPRSRRPRAERGGPMLVRPNTASNVPPNPKS